MKRLYKVKNNEQKCNGFTNAKTWDCHLWLMNTESMYKATLEQVRNGVRGYELATFIKTLFYKNGVNYDELAEDFVRYYEEDIVPFENR